jgi:viroplasmin and RNaseH domain-containing protein
MTWYVVYKGYKPGVYAHWADCNAQVAGFKRNSYQGFPTKEEAVASFLEYMGCDEDAMETNLFPKQQGITEPKQVVGTMNIFLPIAISLIVLLVAMVMYVSKSCCTCPANK